MISPVLFVCLHESLADDRQQGCGWNVFIPSLIKLPWKYLLLPYNTPPPSSTPSPLFLPPTAKHAAAEMFYSVSCTVERSACMSDVEFEYIWHCNLSDLALNEIRFVTPCVPLSVPSNSCSFNSLGKKRYYTIAFHASEVWGCFILSSESCSYGSLAMQIWLGLSRAVAVESPCFCQAFAGLCMCLHRPR